RYKSHLKRYPGSINNPSEYIPAKFIGSKYMLPAWSLQYSGPIRTVIIVGGKIRSKYSCKNKCKDYQHSYYCSLMLKKLPKKNYKFTFLFLSLDFFYFL